MILGNPWGLLALLAIPAILAIHLFRRRFRSHPVSAIWLWGGADPHPAAGRQRQSIRNRASLWLELLAVLALTWYLSDPHLTDREHRRHLVVVCDTRWRLQTAPGEAPSALVRLREALDAQLARLERDDRVSLILTGTPPTVLAGPAAPPSDARAALDDWQARAPRHDPAPAFTLAARLLAGSGGAGRVLWASDAPPTQTDLDVALLLRGQAVPTDGFAAARWLPAAGERPERLALRVFAAGGQPRQRELELRDANGAVLSRARIALDPAAPDLVVLPIPPGDHLQLEAVLLGDDPLALDDRVVLLPPVRADIRVHVALPESASDPLRRAVAAASGAELVGDPATADLAVVAGAAEPAASDAVVWRFAPGDGAPVVGPFLRRGGHPLLRDLDFTGCIWQGGVPAHAVAASDSLLLAGEQVLLSQRPRGFALHCDLEHSGLVRHPVWPALVDNALRLARSRLPGPERRNLLVGQGFSLTLPRGARRLHLFAPDGSSSVLPADRERRVTVPGLEQAGTWELRHDPDQPWTTVRALSLDSRLADCSDCRRADPSGELGERSQVERRRGIFAHLLPLLLAAGAASAAWVVFVREEGAR